ncbi:unnamed protein product, partial [marine sediment metagenome]
EGKDEMQKPEKISIAYCAKKREKEKIRSIIILYLF